MSDPADFSDVKLALHFNGSDGSTTITDSSESARTATVYGNARISTFSSVFGGSSCYFDGTLDYITFPHSSDFNFGSGDFTIEFWLRPSGVTQNRYLLGKAAGSGPSPFHVIITSSGYVKGYCHDGTSSYETPTSGTALVASTWYHIAFVRNSNNLTMYVNGVATGSPVAITASLYVTTTPLCIGNFGYSYAGGSGASIGAFGRLDDLRISVGALYTADFSVPSSQFPDADVTPIAWVTDSGPLGSPVALAKSPAAGVASDAGPLGAPAAIAINKVTCLSSAGGPLGAAGVLAAIPWEAISEAGGPLGVAQLTARQLSAIASGGSPLGIASTLGFHDFTDALDAAGAVTYYTCDLVDGATSTRVPISSWQGTLQTDASCYLQAVVPAVADYADLINDLTEDAEFVIYRGARLGEITIEQELARSTVEQIQFDRGPNRYTCTISGYSAAITAPVDPDPATDRILRGVRSVSSGSSGVRARSKIDWFLQPGQVATAGDNTFVAAYINYYATGTDSYMDVGER